MEKTLCVAGDPLAAPGERTPPGVLFTQHLVPPMEGTRPQWINLGPELNAMGARLIGAGVEFHTGLTAHIGGTVWVEFRAPSGKAVQRLECPNGPAVFPTVIDLIERADHWHNHGGAK